MSFFLDCICLKKSFSPFSWFQQLETQTRLIRNVKIIVLRYCFENSKSINEQRDSQIFPSLTCFFSLDSKFAHYWSWLQYFIFLPFIATESSGNFPASLFFFLGRVEKIMSLPKSYQRPCNFEKQDVLKHLTHGCFRKWIEDQPLARDQFWRCIYTNFDFY